ncbi:hypothetical protein [Pseudoxanthomonas winnipegensis]|uniref:Uncharacterized protein n=1 Tax=Pseudoxanthomonas winnipegensis TaxID=2480810 RepID=A0A4Q8LC91_9GAMM|nr:hypothetical protein [Pseudoxanthomonas winnipegensis]RZZ83203.1 hypothetical protein EA662_15170 [Pseudoxanthomonas winnipegensis]TAA26178.1 hypothetical protein EA661_16765 [Pseudoxanthomonas winnipegensis]TBV72622.1 hypothetical protein EYC46_16470 [Pseudoxanthomonas winnipegensis]
MEHSLPYPQTCEEATPSQVAAELIARHQQADGRVAVLDLARQVPATARASHIEVQVLAQEVAVRLPIPVARKLLSGFPPFSLVPRAPWQRKSLLYRALDALAPLRWVRYRLGRSRYAWVRQRAAHRQGLEAFTVVERATDAAVARFARVVDLHCFADLFGRDGDFRDTVVALVCEHAAPELRDPSGAEQRLNMAALLDLTAWHQGQRGDAATQLGAELVMLAIPASVFERVTAAIRQCMSQRTPVVPAQAPSQEMAAA